MFHIKRKDRQMKDIYLIPPVVAILSFASSAALAQPAMGYHHHFRHQWNSTAASRHLEGLPDASRPFSVGPRIDYNSRSSDDSERLPSWPDGDDRLLEEP